MTCSQKSSPGFRNVRGGASPRASAVCSLSNPYLTHARAASLDSVLKPRSFAPVESHTCTAMGPSILSQWSHRLQLDGRPLRPASNQLDRHISRPLCAWNTYTRLRNIKYNVVMSSIIRSGILVSRFLSYPTSPGQGPSLGCQQQPWPRPAAHGPRRTPCRSRTRTI